MCTILFHPSDDVSPGDWEATPPPPRYSLRTDAELYEEIDEDYPFSETEFIYIDLDTAADKKYRAKVAKDSADSMDASRLYRCTARLKIQVSTTPPGYQPKCHATIGVRVLAGGAAKFSGSISIPADITTNWVNYELKFGDSTASGLDDENIELEIEAGSDTAHRYVLVAGADLQFDPTSFIRGTAGPSARPARKKKK